MGDRYLERGDERRRIDLPPFLKQADLVGRGEETDHAAAMEERESESRGESLIKGHRMWPELVPAPGDGQSGTGDRGDEAGRDPRAGDGGAIIDETDVDTALGECPGETGPCDAAADDEVLAVAGHGGW